MDTYVELQPISVLRVRADMKGAGPRAAFAALEAKLPTLKGRKFYGAFHVSDAGEEYHACVERTSSDDPEKMDLETGSIPGGWYARRKLQDWEDKISQLPILFDTMIKDHGVDPNRPSLEFYRSHTELHLLVPVRGPPADKPRDVSPQNPPGPG